jgi:hypothetical protein
MLVDDLIEPLGFFFFFKKKKKKKKKNTFSCLSDLVSLLSIQVI